MKPCLSESLTMSSSFAEDVAAFADAGCSAMEVWLTKLEKHLEEHTTADTRSLLHSRNLTLAAASYQGGLLVSQGEQRRVHYDHFQRRLGMCQEFSIGTMLIVADSDLPSPPSHSPPRVGGRGRRGSGGEGEEALSIERASVSLKHAAQLAASYGVRLALEFRGKAAWCTSLDTAVGLVEACDEPNLGVAFDVFHYYTGPSKLEDLQLLTPRNVAFVQLCDLAGVPRELATDSDRILPGEGDFQLGPILDQLRRIGYDGWVSVELFNPELWKMKPVQVAEAAITALRRVLGLAGM